MLRKYVSRAVAASSIAGVVTVAVLAPSHASAEVESSGLTGPLIDGPLIDGPLIEGSILSDIGNLLFFGNFMDA